MTNPDYKIEEYFDLDGMKVVFTLLKQNRMNVNDYILIRKFDTLVEARTCVRMLRKYENRVFHYVED